MSRTQTERLWLLAGAVLALLLVAIGYLLVISPQRGKTSQVGQQLSDARLLNTTMAGRVAQLAAQNTRLSTYRQQLAMARRALPADTGIPDFLRTLQSLGEATAVDVTSLSVGTPTPVAQTGSSSSTGTVPAAGTAPAAGAASTDGVYQLSLTAAASGTPQALDGFLGRLQAVQPRAVLVGSVAEAGGAAAPGTAAAVQTLTLTMQVFVQPPAGNGTAAVGPGQ